MSKRQMVAFIMPTLMSGMALAAPNGAPAAKSTEPELTGEIVSLNMNKTSNQITLRVLEHARPTERVVAVEKGTLIRGQGGPLHLSDLKTGDRVTVLYELSQGKLLARRIQVQKL